MERKLYMSLINIELLTSGLGSDPDIPSDAGFEFSGDITHWLKRNAHVLSSSIDRRFAVGPHCDGPLMGDARGRK